MSVYNDIIGEVTGAIPKLSAPQCSQLMNRAWGRIRDYRMWSWQYITQGQIWNPAQITAGAATATYGSTQVQFTPAAQAIIAAIPLQVPFASPILGQGYQIRLNYGPTSGALQNGQFGPYYSIFAYNSGTGVATLDRPFGEPTVTLSPFQAFKVYYGPPSLPTTNLNSPDLGFKGYDTLTNIQEGYTISGPRLNFSQVWLNRMDPQRGGTYDPFVLSYFSKNSLGQPVYEWYPGPVYQYTWICSYWSRWADLSGSQDPPITSYDLYSLIKYYTEYLACQWSLKNVSTFPELGRTNWIPLIELAKTEFMQSMTTCVRADDSMMPTVPLKQGRYLDFPVGGSFLQNHDLSSLIR